MFNAQHSYPKVNPQYSQTGDFYAREISTPQSNAYLPRSRPPQHNSATVFRNTGYEPAKNLQHQCHIERLSMERIYLNAPMVKTENYPNLPSWNTSAHSSSSPSFTNFQVQPPLFHVKEPGRLAGGQVRWCFCDIIFVVAEHFQRLQNIYHLPLCR